MFARITLLLCLGLAAGSAGAETLTLPQAQRPAWLRRDGIVMAGSWEPLLFRVRPAARKSSVTRRFCRSSCEMKTFPISGRSFGISFAFRTVVTQRR